MTSTATEHLRLRKQGTGDNNNTWGELLNQTLDNIDRAIAGVTRIEATGGSYTLAVSDFEADEVRRPIIIVTGTLVANLTLIFPSTVRQYLVINDTTGAYSFTLSSGGSETRVVPQGMRGVFLINGSNVENVGPLTDSQGAFNGAINVQNLTASGALAAASLSITGGASVTTLQVSGLSTFASVDINGGSIDGTIIGAASAAAGTFTSLTVSGGAALTSGDLVLAQNPSSNLHATTKQYVDAAVAGVPLGDYAPLDSPVLTGVPTAPTATPETDTAQIATTAFVIATRDSLVEGAPGGLNTLNKLAAAVGDDESFSITTATALAGKAALSHSHIIDDVTGLQTALDGKQASLGFTPEDIANKGVAGGYASLDGSGLVPSAQLPSFVDDVIEAADFASLPGTGTSGKIYVTIDDGKTYRWGGSAYAEISASPGSTDVVTEGSTNLYFTTGRVLGTALTGYSAGSNTALSASDTVVGAMGKIQGQLNAKAASSHTHSIANITNLQTELDAKAALSHSHSIANVTGLQTALDGKAASSHSHSASDVTSGTLDIARLPVASQAEAEAGTVSNKSMTPQRTAQAIAAQTAGGVPSAAIVAFAENAVPAGWLKCNGAAISRTTYAALFAKIGTTYGVGDGSTTFNIPDLRGEFIRGHDDGRGVDSGRAFGSFQDHSIGSQDFESWAQRYAAYAYGSNSFYVYGPKSGDPNYGGSAPGTYGSALTATDYGETRPRNVAMVFCIKY